MKWNYQEITRTDRTHTIDKEINFSKHIVKLYCNAQYKLYTLRKIRKYLNLAKM